MGDMTKGLRREQKNLSNMRITVIGPKLSGKSRFLSILDGTQNEESPVYITSTETVFNHYCK